MLYIYAWKNNVKRAAMFGRFCRLLARGAKNSCLIEFVDNHQREIISRNALRRAKLLGALHGQLTSPFHV